MTGTTRHYQVLESRFARLADLKGALELLDWDRQVNMPPGGAEVRAQQQATLEGLMHEMLTAPEIGAALDEADGDQARLEPWERANLREMRRQYAHGAAVPQDLVTAKVRAATLCEQKWRTAREKDDFGSVLPGLREVVKLTREEAQAKAEALGLEPYDALLDYFDPDLRQTTIDRLFGPLEAALPAMVDEVLAAQATRRRPVPPRGPFPQEAQEALGRKVMGTLGFNFAQGRLDVATHPFCGGVSEDVRLTTRYDQNNFTESLMGIVHETGHALYEAGLPKAWQRQPVGQPRGMSLHESQSLIIEMQAGRSRAFISWLAGAAREVFGGQGPSWEADNLYRLAIRVERSFIRVDADEVTYPIHIVLRTRLERALLSGDLDPGDLPGAWNDGMEELLHIRPATDREGCLQDIHWFDGAIGYFPCYTMGALIAAQLYETVLATEPSLPEQLARGDFTFLRNWVAMHVWSKGSSLSTEQIVQEATGQPLSADALLRHLRRRYIDDVG